MFKHIDIIINTQGDGLYEITSQVINELEKINVKEGLCNLFIKHTSASLIIQENADPTAKFDLENWLKKLVPYNDSSFTDTLEGPDDMPSHIKSVLTQTSITVPIINEKLSLGMWQGIYLWEHRTAYHRRVINLSVLF